MATANREVDRVSSLPQAENGRSGSTVEGSAGVMGLGREAPAIELWEAQNIIHCLLFIIEFSGSPDPRWRVHKRHLSLFFSRAGGLHLLVMLLNAYYHKPKAHRRPGWVFRGMRDRIQISERALRMLINDAMAAGLIVKLPQEQDRRRHSYGLTRPVVDAWEALTETLRNSLGDVLGQFDAGSLANADYRKWNPALPACEQIDLLPPSRRHKCD